MSAAGAQAILIMQLVVRHDDRPMMAPDEPGEQRNGYPDQRGADEEILEAGTLDDEARGTARKLPGSAQSEVISAFGWRRTPSTRAMTCR